MQIIRSLKEGAGRAIKLWKGILIVWLFSFLLAAVYVLPLRGALKTGFGDSMIVERLTDGLDIEVFADLGQYLSGIFSYFLSGFFLVVLTGFLLNVFFAGGLFGGLKESAAGYKLSEFFRESARNFWSFLIISVLVSLMIIGLAVILVVIPLSMIMQSATLSEGAAYRAGMILVTIFLLLLPLPLLVADYSRAWQVSEERKSGLKALGSGFRLTFSTILRSWLMMLILLILQGLLAYIILSVVPPVMPDSGFGLFLLFLISQILFIIRILLKTWRYGSVSVFREAHDDFAMKMKREEDQQDQVEQASSEPPDQA